MRKTLVIMAAGLGSRYGGLKQLDAVGPGGETILEYSVYDAVQAGFTNVVLIIRRDIEKDFILRFGSRFASLVNVSYVFQDIRDLPDGLRGPEERTKPWGTGQALLAARQEVKTPFTIINADDLYGREAFVAASAYLEKISSRELKAAMIGYKLKNTLSEYGSVARGICKTDGNNSLTDIEEVLGIEKAGENRIISQASFPLEAENTVSMNMWLFTPPVFDFAREEFKNFLKQEHGNLTSEFYIPTIVRQLIQNRKTTVDVIPTDSRWYGVTYQEDKPSVQEHILKNIEQGIYPADLWSSR